MKYSKIIILISSLLFFASCKKSDSQPEPEKDEFSFTYNSQNYNYIVTGNVANAGVYKGSYGTPAILINMIDVFGGSIFYEKPGCAYLVPDITTVHFNQECIPSLDSANVFIYQSGSLNVSFSNCVTKSGVDIWTGLNYKYDDCAASGTFDLTLVNKNNEIIKITNGVVKFHHIIIR